MSYSFYLLKRWLEDIILFPLVATGKLFKNRLPNISVDYVLIFPFHHLGGAERVHLNISRALKDKKCLILFTRKSDSLGFRKSFEATGHMICDISLFTDNKWIYFCNIFYRGVVAGWVNEKRLVVFNGQSNFGYKISPWIDPSIAQVELIHAFCSFSWIRIPFAAFYQKTIMISKFAIAQHEQQYTSLSVPETLKQHIVYIPNGIDTPLSEKSKEPPPPLNVLFVGRPDRDKRPELFAQIAERCSAAGLKTRFHVIGVPKEFIATAYHPYLVFHGTLSSDTQLNALYHEGHVLVLCSLHEGFPMVIAEAMMAGNAILSTPVGDVPHHVHDAKNGFLFTSIKNNETIILEAVDHIRQFIEDPDQLQHMAENNKHYAKEVFGMTTFENRYRELLTETIHS